MLKVPHMRYEKQIEEVVAWLTKRDYYQRVYGVRGDSTGQGDMPMEFLQDHTRLPVEEESHVKFSMQSKNIMYTGFQEALERDEGDPMRFSYPSTIPSPRSSRSRCSASCRSTSGTGSTSRSTTTRTTRRPTMMPQMQRRSPYLQLQEAA